MGPRLLLADEPTGNLDRASAAEVMALLEDMNAEGLTLVVVTHDPAVAERAARVLRMDDGQLVENRGAPPLTPYGGLDAGVEHPPLRG